jgi:Peroxin-3
MREEMLRKFDISNLVLSGVVSSVGGVVGGLLGSGVERGFGADVGTVVGGVFGENVRASLGLGAGGSRGKNGEEGGEGLGGMQAMLEKLLEGGLLDDTSPLSDDEDEDDQVEEESYEDSLYAASFPQWSSSHSSSSNAKQQHRGTRPKKLKKPIRKGKISSETENKYLTLSWWLLHVGCKDVGERVRRGVEDVFEGCVFVFLSPLSFSTLPSCVSSSMS